MEHNQLIYLGRPNICLVNGYQIYKHKVKDRGRRLHRKFQEELTDILMNWPYEDPKKEIIPNQQASTHK
jgi:hypothetical protein